MLMVLHLDSWRDQRVVLYFGWLPEEVVYRLCWVALVWVYLLFLTSRPYPLGPPEVELESSEGAALESGREGPTS